MKHAKIKAAEDEREQLEEEINSLRTDLRLARSNTKIYGEKERGKEFSPLIEVPNFQLDQFEFAALLLPLGGVRVLF